MIIKDLTPLISFVSNGFTFRKKVNVKIIKDLTQLIYFVSNGFT